MAVPIVWQVRARVTYDSFQSGQLDRRANGGNSYDYQAMRVLATAFDLTLDPAAVRATSGSLLRYWWRLRKGPPPCTMIIKDPQVVVMGPLGVVPVEVGMVHHINYLLPQSSSSDRWYLNRLKRRLARLSAVVTVSRFWQRELENMGCRRVSVIYNSFDMEEFEHRPGEVDSFLQKYALPTDRPLVYIGSSTAAKGAAEVYEVLKDEGYTLVMTGPKNEVTVPARWFNLERPEYLCLLKACSVVINMSLFAEGWNRIAHEAMACKTPVIGSGAGGMGELLTGGRQIALGDTRGLRAAVRSVLDGRQAWANSGYDYVSQFDEEYFRGAWISFAREMTGPGQTGPRQTGSEQ